MAAAADLTVDAPPRRAAAPLGLSKQAATLASSPLADARQAWRRGPAPAWQTAQHEGTQGEVQDRWLTRLQAAINGPWQTAAAPEDRPQVRWLGAEGGQLWLSAEGRVWWARQGQVQVAPVAAAEAAALLAELASWR